MHTEQKIRVGVIGAGFISQVTHLHALSKSSKAKIIAIADARTNLCQQVASLFSIPNTYANYDEMLHQIPLDAVIVCVARPCLSAAVAATLERKISTLSEKPMAQTLKDAEKLSHLSAQNNTNYYVGFMRRCDAGVQLFKEKLQTALQENTYGPILHAILYDFCGEYAVPIPFHLKPFEKPSHRYPEWQKVPDSFPLEWSQDYEYSLNVLIHDINLLRYLFEEELTAKVFKVKHGFSQTAILDAKDFSISVHVGRAKLGKWDQVLQVYFERGRLTLHLPSPLARQETACVEELSQGKQCFSYPKEKTWAFERQMELFLLAKNGEKKLTATCQDSIKDIKLLEKLWSLKEN